jgi:hypothetical protein
VTPAGKRKASLSARSVEKGLSSVVMWGAGGDAFTAGAFGKGGTSAARQFL